MVTCHCLLCKKTYEDYRVDYKSPGYKELDLGKDIHGSDLTCVPKDGDLIHMLILNDRGQASHRETSPDGLFWGLCTRCYGKELVRAGQVIQLGGGVIRG